MGMNRRLAVLLLFMIVLSQNIIAQNAKWNSRYQSYIDQYKGIAIREMLKYGIPASITMAQAILESGAGQSDLARKGNNHFGIKCHGWEGRTMNHDDDLNGECFRVYDDPLESFEDHSLFLVKRSHYKPLFSLDRTDYKGWAHGLKKCGYATSPTYAKRLIEIIELYNLDDLDEAKETVESRKQKVDSHISDVNTGAVVGGMHRIYAWNKNLYVVARSGDTFKSIGEEVGISHKKLAKYNERHHKEVLNNGDIIYLRKKQSKADKSFKGKMHIVRQGESMYSIAQKYGIRLKSLYEKNHLQPDYQLTAGDRLKVY